MVKPFPVEPKAEQGGAEPSMEQIEDGGVLDQPWLVEREVCVVEAVGRSSEQGRGGQRCKNLCLG